MNINLDQAIAESKVLMTRPHYIGNPGYSEYSHVYFSTTENIKGYLENEKFNTNSALTVLASSDQVFNLVLNNIYDITAFDLNKLTYFNYFFKQALIYNFTYKEYFDFINKYLNYYINFKNIKNEFYKLKNYLPNDVFNYFNELLIFNEKLNDCGLYAHKNYLKNLYVNSGVKKNFNSYLSNEANYNELKSKLLNLKIDFIFDNALNIPNLLTKKYDVILLSNISDYLYMFKKGFNHQDFNEFIWY